MQGQQKSTMALEEKALHRPPFCLVRSDWEEVCLPLLRPRTASGGPSSFWVSYTPPNRQAKTMHGNVLLKPTEQGQLGFQSEEGFTADIDFRTKQLRITPPGGDMPFLFQAPTNTWKEIHLGSPINSIDISPGGELAITGSANGLVRVWQTSDGIMRRDLRGHVADIACVEWFPSGKVALTGSDDLQLKIWDILKGECGATLKGHAGRITDSAIIERGRNVISCSRDGTARLWDVSTQKTIYMFGQITFENGLNACCVDQSPLSLPTPTTAPHAKEVGTEGKLLVVAEEAGRTTGYDLRGRQRVFQTETGQALNCCLMHGHTLLAGGNEGVIYQWDIRQLTAPLTTLQISLAPIKTLSFMRGGVRISFLSVPGTTPHPTITGSENAATVVPPDVHVTGSSVGTSGTTTGEASTSSSGQEGTTTTSSGLWVGTGDGLFMEVSLEDFSWSVSLSGGGTLVTPSDAKR